MSKESSNQSSKKLYIYSGHQGGRFLFDKRLNKNELEYNRFTYLGTLNEVISKVPQSVRGMAIRAAKARGEYEDV